MNFFSPHAFFAVLAALSSVAHAQDVRPGDAPRGVPGAATNAANGAAQVVEIEENSLSTLPALLLRGGGPGAISLRLSEEALEANPAARDALLSWVRAGGTVFLHTGAARAFGFQTVPARLGTNAVAGQLYGRARAALPFGAHPLLRDAGQSGRDFNGARGGDPTQLPGVNVVFYELREGDDLVVSHPAGTPLLEVSDLMVNAQNPLYAAAMAPFGRGFAVFTPDFIDQKRGDGALFARNLLNLTSPRGKSEVRFVGIGASAIESGVANPAVLQNALSRAAAFQNSSPALPAFGTGIANANANANANEAGATAINPAPRAENLPAEILPDAPQTPDLVEAQVLMTGAEAGSYARLLAAGGERANAATNLLQARLFLARGEAERAAGAVEAGAQLAPDIAEVALLRGILLAGSAQETSLASPIRAQLLNDAAQNLAQAARSVSITSGFANSNAPNPNANNGDNRSQSLAGIPLAALGNWSTKLGQIAQVFALEPPLVQRFGVGDGSITVRGAANDNTLGLVTLGAQALANSRTFGWHGDREEILVFPTPQSYLAYRAALGINGPTVPLSAGAVGDVVGQRILMLSLPPAAILTRNSPSNVLARLHSYVLLRAFDENASAPAWLQFGLENLANAAIDGPIATNTNNQTLEQVVRVGGLLTPDQFANVFDAAQPNFFLIAQAQATAMMTYFYRAFGAGAVAETVQRLGAGQSIDEALQATTQGNQSAFFENWRSAQFGPRNFPNAG